MRSRSVLSRKALWGWTAASVVVGIGSSLVLGAEAARWFRSISDEAFVVALPVAVCAVLLFAIFVVGVLLWLMSPPRDDWGGRPY
jgi:hypothetical protein